MVNISEEIKKFLNELTWKTKERGELRGLISLWKALNLLDTVILLTC